MPPGPQSAERPGWVRRLGGYARAHRRLVVAAGGAAAGTALLGVAMPLVLRHVVDLLLADPASS
ncbi:MAG: hypothetical protein ACXVF0_19345, partial [Blastococcus sp.]